jgi:hypothetical protein
MQHPPGLTRIQVTGRFLEHFRTSSSWAQDVATCSSYGLHSNLPRSPRVLKLWEFVSAYWALTAAAERESLRLPVLPSLTVFHDRNDQLQFTDIFTRRKKKISLSTQIALKWHSGNLLNCCTWIVCYFQNFKLIKWTVYMLWSPLARLPGCTWTRVSRWRHPFRCGSAHSAV